MERIEQLRQEISNREAELAKLKQELAAAERSQHETDATNDKWKWPLQQYEYERYSRQMIVPNFGLEGQLRLRKAKVLVVGAGGLGCPAAAYLAGAGVSTLGLIDGDSVETSNLHRQIAHSTERVGMSKVDSAVAYLQQLNPTITYRKYISPLSSQNALDIISNYDLVLDCTDHPTSRYLTSDACVLLSKPLVSASAFQTSGQLIVLNSPPGKGPCYRCVFPKPPPPESVVGCGEGGILGPVVGVMGVLQALEAIKLIARGGLGKGFDEEKTPTMLLFSGAGDISFRSVRMRGKRKDCFACGEVPEGAEEGLTAEAMRTSMDYVQFCGVVAPVTVLKPEERITAEKYAELAERQGTSVDLGHVLIDVREKEHFDMSHLDGAVNLPLSRVTAYRGQNIEELLPGGLQPGKDVYTICHRGNDSQIVAEKLKALSSAEKVEQKFIGDIEGGMLAWKAKVDPTIPLS
ncbi:thiF family protein [Sarocladium implicatum]|nr:thiF family protein [Sarocladium implicatum]